MNRSLTLFFYRQISFVFADAAFLADFGWTIYIIYRTIVANDSKDTKEGLVALFFLAGGLLMFGYLVAMQMRAFVNDSKFHKIARALLRNPNLIE